jgi:hypothetical protein
MRANVEVFFHSIDCFYKKNFCWAEMAGASCRRERTGRDEGLFLPPLSGRISGNFEKTALLRFCRFGNLSYLCMLLIFK